MPLHGNDVPELVERCCLIKFAYHLWRVDTAARKFPPRGDDDQKNYLMKQRWNIGLVLELEDLRRYIADACMMGYMTTSLSQSISRILDWAQIDSYPVQILWEKLPDANHPRAPMFPWMFGQSSNYFKSQLHWWDDPDSEEHKPPWWNRPIPVKWLHEVRIPRSLLGKQVAALKDARSLIRNADKLICLDSEEIAKLRSTIMELGSAP
ncbi:hypothetical protein QCA50_000992 [Cerrena zonata]|uniref:Uncharacterized protein n=1 Tax=Cerrena zonata TaxID=2478898 RepID=A0AAW0GSD8_9APHY